MPGEGRSLIQRGFHADVATRHPHLALLLRHADRWMRQEGQCRGRYDFDHGGIIDSFHDIRRARRAGTDQPG
jgi:hypothetical protein